MTNETELQEALQLLGKGNWTLATLEQTILDLRASKKKPKRKRKNAKKI